MIRQCNQIKHCLITTNSEQIEQGNLDQYIPLKEVQKQVQQDKTPTALADILQVRHTQTGFKINVACRHHTDMWLVCLDPRVYTPEFTNNTCTFLLNFCL